jgi:GNAT superfamily N-acetyltransferase
MPTWHPGAPGAKLRRMGARQLKDELRQSEEAWDQQEVPAAVVCALCGDPGCAGCSFESTTRSGIVAIVPWERPGGAPLARLWATARATTKDAESFFGALPDGPIAPAFGFAVLAELLATLSWGLVWGPVLVAAFPGWCRHLAVDPHARGIALRVLVAALPTFALMLVGAHAAHGVSLHHGARKAGATSSRRRALRFGLYATGWDLVVGPLGACIIATKEGLVAASELLQLASGLPTRSAKAFLRGVCGLDVPRTKEALTTSYIAAVVATLVAAFVVVGVLVVAVLLFPPHLLSY